MESFDAILSAINGVLWHDAVLIFIVGVGILFTFWSAFSQYRALTHGTQVIRGKFDHKNDPGAINHFQALSAALSATVGLGNIAGVAVAISLGGPGAVFWMWVVGFLGMAIKMTEVTLAMLYRNIDDAQNPQGGPMWVAQKGFAKMGPGWAKVGSWVGGIFCVTLLISTFTGGNMFQAWNVAVVTDQYFDVPHVVTGIILTVMVGAVILGGIQRIGAVAGRLVPFMCGIYLLAGIYVIGVNISAIPGILKLIVASAFNPAESGGAFVGGTAGFAFLWGMKRALFSNEAGQGSSPIAHSAAKTDEPVREGVVAGLEPFIDTLVVCTITAMVVLVSGAWNRGPEASFSTIPEPTLSSDSTWTLPDAPLPKNEFAQWKHGRDQVFLIAHSPTVDADTGTRLIRWFGQVEEREKTFWVKWSPLKLAAKPELKDAGIYTHYVGAGLTGHAFDRVVPGTGRWLVTLVVWLFALSTIISWSYYGEQSMIYLFGPRSVTPYRIIYCLLIMVSCGGFITTEESLDNLTGLGTGVMLFANIPIMLIFGKEAMDAYKTYIRRLDAGEFHAHAPPPVVDVVEGREISG